MMALVMEMMKAGTTKALTIDTTNDESGCHTWFEWAADHVSFESSTTRPTDRPPSYESHLADLDVRQWLWRWRCRDTGLIEHFP